MTEFKIGDRVRQVDDSPSVPYGSLGTVVEADSTSGWPGAHVIWDEYVGNTWPADYRWAADDDELEIV